MSRLHDQRGAPIERSILCTSCKNLNCKKCIDVGRKVVFGPGVIELCNCKHEEQFSESS